MGRTPDAPAPASAHDQGYQVTPVTGRVTKECNIMTMADENAEIVRQGYEAFNTADVEALTRLFAGNSSWHTPGSSSIAGDARAATPSSPTSAGTGERRRRPSTPPWSRYSRASTAG